MKISAAELPQRDIKTEAIIKAARQTFLARGFDGASMDQIALTANVSKRTVYNRFRSKDELFGAAIEETCRALLPLNIEDIEKTLSPREFITRVAKEVVSGLLSPSSLSLRRIAAFESERTPAIGQAYLEHGPLWLIENVAPILERIAERGGLKIDDPRQAVWRLGTLATEPLLTHLTMGGKVDDIDKAVEKQVETGLEAFFAIYSVD